MNGNLYEEYQNSEVGKEFKKIENQIDEWEKNRLLVNHNKKIQDKLEEGIALLRLHLQNYQRIILFNRRRARQRLRRKHCTMRNFFIQSLMETQIRFVELHPLAVEPRMLIASNTGNRQLYGKQRYLSEDEKDDLINLSFYNDIVLKFTNDQWMDTFHISKNIFNLICSRLKASLDNSINMDVENWIAMCIYMLASGRKFSSVALLFNVDKEYARQSLFNFSKTLLKEFSDEISMPNTKYDLETISCGFYKASNMMPCVAGVLGLFIVPNTCECVPHNTCGSENIKVQVCLDNSLLIRKVETTIDNPTMFLQSPNVINQYSQKFNGNLEMPYFIVTPDHYPLRNWLMQKYGSPDQPWEYNFNKSCASLNIYREVSMQRLFGRWHILNTTECILPDSKTLIIKACCLLHNILEENKEEFSLEWCKAFQPSKYDYKLHATGTQQLTDSKNAMEKRDVIAKLMFHNAMVMNGMLK